MCLLGTHCVAVCVFKEYYDFFVFFKLKVELILNILYA